MGRESRNSSWRWHYAWRHSWWNSSNSHTRDKPLEERWACSVDTRQDLVRFFHQQRHLAPDCRVPRTAFVLNSISIHAGFDALFQPTRPTLISMGLVHLTPTVAFILANILSVASYGAFEESSASVASKYPVMFAARIIVAHFTRHVS